VDNQYQALQNSGNVRLIRKLQPDLGLAGVYEAPDVLFSQVERIQGAFPIVVNQLIPAQMQSKFSQLRGYTRDAEAPVLQDDPELARAIEAIRARRVELLGLARNEAAVATGRWYALTRISQDLQEILQQLARWDTSTTPIDVDLAECRAPRRQPTPPKE
jgi:hypothetical protein